MPVPYIKYDNLKEFYEEVMPMQQDIPHVPSVDRCTSSHPGRQIAAYIRNRRNL